MGIEDVLRKNEGRLMRISGVVGVGIGESEGTPVILVMVKEPIPQLRSKIPHHLDGFEVKIEVVGEIRAF